MLFMICIYHAFASVHCCLVVTCWGRADLLALVCDFYCVFVTFPCGILGQVWYLIVSFPDLSYINEANTLALCILENLKLVFQQTVKAQMKCCFTVL